MNKKQQMLYIIEQFEKSAHNIPSPLQNQFDEIKQSLEQLSDGEVEGLDGAVWGPASQQPYDPNDPVEMLFNCYSDMESLAFTGETNEQLESAILQMRGLYDIPDRYFP